jgi:undecaprenyl-diphosphatase
MRSARRRRPDAGGPLMLMATVHLTVPTHLTWLQAIVIGFVQGITELFPVSSLGHSVLIPELFGWHHVANALALLVFFWRDWVRVIRGFFTSLAKRRAETSAEKLAWLIIVATIPVGIVGLLLEHKIRDLLAKPLSAAIFLMINGVILLGGERVRRTSVTREKARKAAAVGAGPAAGAAPDAAVVTEARLARLPYREAGLIGVVQCLALIAGISRDGVTMVAGLVRGLDNEDAAKFAFMLSTPVILAAGILKVGDLTGPLGNGVRGQIIAGTVVTFVASLFAVRFLSAYFKDRGLNVFGVYCLLFGAFMTVFVVAGL